LTHAARADKCGDSYERPPQPTAAPTVVDPPRPPQRHCAHTDEKQTDGNRRETGVVVPGEPARVEVVEALDPDDDAEDPEQRGD
jgi:hypothetical protein